MAAAVAAPEVICAKTHYDGEKADIWSCGVMLYVMLFCEYPFERPEDDADKHGFQKVHRMSGGLNLCWGTEQRLLPVLSRRGLTFSCIAC